ncbi:hypothetical protein EGW08_021739, partial [Elysia chlorotica]
GVGVEGGDADRDKTATAGTGRSSSSNNSGNDNNYTCTQCQPEEQVATVADIHQTQPDPEVTEVKAVAYCLNCDEFLCTACRERHVIEAETCSHRTQPVDKYDPELSPRSPRALAQEHG